MPFPISAPYNSEQVINTTLPKIEMKFSLIASLKNIINTYSTVQFIGPPPSSLEISFLSKIHKVRRGIHVALKQLQRQEKAISYG